MSHFRNTIEPRVIRLKRISSRRWYRLISDRTGSILDVIDDIVVELLEFDCLVSCSAQRHSMSDQQYLTAKDAAKVLIHIQTIYIEGTKSLLPNSSLTVSLSENPKCSGRHISVWASPLHRHYRVDAEARGLSIEQNK